MAQRFWRQSAYDLEAAKRLVYPGTWYAAASFAHQAAEKALKAAIWHVRGEEPPWTHALVACAELVSERVGSLPPNVQLAVERPQPLFEAVRYPSGIADDPIPADLITEEDAAAAIRFGEEVCVWVEKLLQQPVSRPDRSR